MKPLIIVIDEHIPYIKGLLEEVACVIYMPGRQINAAVVKEADALIIRTRTKCDASLLEGRVVSALSPLLRLVMITLMFHTVHEKVSAGPTRRDAIHLR